MLRLGAELLAVQPQVIGVAEHLLEERTAPARVLPNRAAIRRPYAQALEVAGHILACKEIPLSDPGPLLVGVSAASPRVEFSLAKLCIQTASGTRLTSQPASAAITRSRVVIVADPPYSTLLRTAQLELASGTGLFRQHPLDDRVIRSKPPRQDGQDSSIELLGLGVVCLAGVGFGDDLDR